MPVSAGTKRSSKLSDETDLVGPCFADVTKPLRLAVLNRFGLIQKVSLMQHWCTSETARQIEVSPTLTD